MGPLGSWEGGSKGTTNWLVSAELPMHARAKMQVFWGDLGTAALGGVGPQCRLNFGHLNGRGIFFLNKFLKVLGN